MKSISRLLAGLLLFLVLFLPSGYTQAQAAVTFSGLSASHVFGESLQFEAQISTTEPISRLELTFRPSGGSSQVIPVTVADGSRLSAVYQITSLGGFAPFAEISYWFSATLNSGEQVQSEAAVLTYSDNRYTWQSLNYGRDYRAFWIEGDTSFGQAILDAAVNALTHFEPYLTLPIPETLELYVYPSTSTLQSALTVSGTTWTAGQADPQGNKIYAAVSNSYDYRLDMENTIPHELVHVRLWLLLGENYSNLPVWLNEGIATLAERNPSDKTAVLTAALEGGRLYTFKALCPSFPGDSSGAAVAYAQSEALVRYIYDRYGKLGLQTLVEAYGAGHSCENGVLGSLGISLDALEDAWYGVQFGENAPINGPTLEAISWTVLGVMVLLTPLALILFSKRQYDKEEIVEENGP